MQRVCFVMGVTNGLWEQKTAALAAEVARWRALREATVFAGVATPPLGG